jgi:hypothetical protein
MSLCAAVCEEDSSHMRSSCADQNVLVQVVGARDQRVTALAVSVLLGASVLMAPILKLVPFAVLFGVFLYMGISGGFSIAVGIATSKCSAAIFKSAKNI